MTARQNQLADLEKKVAHYKVGRCNMLSNMLLHVVMCHVCLKACHLNCLVMCCFILMWSGVAVQAVVGPLRAD
jgi:hypothetical protein